MDNLELKTAFAGTIGNHELIKKSKRCGCYFCRATFVAPRISQWFNRAGEPVPATAKGASAVCPLCEAAAVIGDASGFPLTEAMLGELGNFAMQAIQDQYEPIRERSDEELQAEEMEAAEAEEPEVERLWGKRFYDEDEGEEEHEGR